MRVDMNMRRTALGLRNSSHSMAMKKALNSPSCYKALASSCAILSLTVASIRPVETL